LVYTLSWSLNHAALPVYTRAPTSQHECFQEGCISKSRQSFISGAIPKDDQQRSSKRLSGDSRPILRRKSLLAGVLRERWGRTKARKVTLGSLSIRRLNDDSETYQPIPRSTTKGPSARRHGEDGVTEAQMDILRAARRPSVKKAVPCPRETR